jgi:hypothetical protein
MKDREYGQFRFVPDAPKWVNLLLAGLNFIHAGWYGAEVYDNEPAHCTQFAQ